MRFSTHIWASIRAFAFDRIGVAAILIAATSVSCGSKPKSSGQHEGASQFSTADFLRTPPQAVYVKPGSREVVITPEASDTTGIRYVQLYSEPGAEIYFSLLGEEDLAPGKRYQTPIIMVPPFEIFAVAIKDGHRGPVRSARFGAADAVNALATHGGLTRFSETPDLNFEPAVIRESFAAQNSDSERLSAKDPAGDMPSISQMADLTGYDVVSTDEALRVRINFAEAPIHHGKVIYGVEIGPANILPESFGNGAEYIWRVDCNLKACRLTNQTSEQAISQHGITVFSEESRLEIRIPMDALGDSVKTHTAIRAFAIDARRDTPSLDRTLPVYLHSPFQMHRLDLERMSSAAAQIKFFEDENQADGELINEYSSLVQTLGPLIEEVNLYPLFNQGSTPFFVMPGSVSGFTGINSTDRGLFSALGSDASRLALIQLIAHEFAHFQNSGWSRIDSRWIQEGYSEWTAQRIMYRKLPSRAVYRFLNQLRMRPFQQLVAKGEADAPLNEWNSLETNYGYEKVFAFFQILEREVGVSALVRAQLLGRNQELDTNSFQELLEKISGKDLEKLFSFWVRPGPVYPEYDPAILFADQDNDGILAIDEKHFNTLDTLVDTDLDGFEDGESILNPSLKAAYEPELASQSPVVLNTQSKTPNDFLRIKSNLADIQFSRNSLLTEATDFEQHESGVLLRPPFSIVVKSDDKISPFHVSAVRPDSQGSIRPIEISDTAESKGILPSQALKSPNTGLTAEWIQPKAPLEIDDAASDTPELFAGLDIVRASVEELDNQVVVRIDTKADIDRHGEFGGFFLEFSRFRIEARALPSILGSFSIRTSANANIAFDSNGADHPTDVRVKIRFQAKKQAEITIPNNLIKDFLDESASSQLCIESQMTTDSGKELKDRAGCIQLRWSGFDLWRGKLTSVYGEAVHQIDLMVPAGTDALTSEFLKVAAESGVRDFQQQLQRPLWDRYHWPIRIMFNRNSEIWTDLDRNFGVFLSSVAPEDAFPLAGTAQLMLEQMARLILPDGRERLKSNSPLWVREFFATWLGLSAASSFAPTKEVHEFNHDYRISHYLCYQDFSCPSYTSLRINFSNERGQPLHEWREFYDNSLAQQKLLMSVIELHSIIGSQGLRRVMGGFYNHQPSADQFLRIIIGSYPGRQDELSAWADRWGLRSMSGQRIQPTSVLPLFEDNTGLMLYPAQRNYLQRYIPSLTPEQYEGSW
jgi:hypothetical protein